MVARVRRILELEPSGEDDGTNKRASRVRVRGRFSQLRLLPTAAQLREVRRVAFDDASRVRHFFLTRQPPRDLVKWDYVRGSGSDGIRRYRNSDGDEKRLRGYNNRYWEAASPVEEDSSSDEDDDGIYYGNSNAETEGCYAPAVEDPAALQELIANSHSYLEHDDGTDERRILAVCFDPVGSIQRAIDVAACPGPTSAADAVSTPAVVTFAADGGKIRGKLVTAFTAAVAWTHLQHGRTDLIPLAYSLSGEKQVDELVGKKVRVMLQEVVTAKISYPVYGLEADAVASSGADPPPAPRVQLTICKEIQVCGTFIASPVERLPILV